MNSRRTITSRCQRRGFTLLELLIATAAGAIVLIAIFGVFSRAIHLRDDATARTRVAQVQRRAASVIRNDLRGARISGGTMAAELKGSRDSQEGGFPGYLKLTTTSATDPADAIGSELQQVEYFIVTDPASQDRNAGLLVRAVDRNLLAPVRQKAPEEPLLAGVESMEVSFYDGDTWKESWEITEEDKTVPQAIRVRIHPSASSAVNGAPLPIEIMVPWTTQAAVTTAAAADTTGGQTPPPNP